MQCCTCSKWVHSRCSLLSICRFKTLGSSHSWSCPSCFVPALTSGDPTPTNTVSSSSESFCLFTFSLLPGPSGSPSANGALPLHPRPQTSYPPFTHFMSYPSAPSLSPPVSGYFFISPSSFPPPLTPSGFFNGMLEVPILGAVNYYNLSCHILLTLSVSRNLTLTYLPLSGSLNSLRFDRIHSRSGVFFPDVSHAGGDVIIFVRQGLFSKVCTFSVSSLDPYSDYVGDQHLIKQLLFVLFPCLCSPYSVFDG